MSVKLNRCLKLLKFIEEHDPTRYDIICDKIKDYMHDNGCIYYEAVRRHLYDALDEVYEHDYKAGELLCELYEKKLLEENTCKKLKN
jgi:hypothetical protein